ncbi:hypothetical protein [Paenibacillus kobensis]|uniref:hypothetical protein n=1 Tax=Paenibacillus kobensis TaxID=59841 RepID=UPI000FDB95BD|nr:hypothetical protein [Paenibacillus kobensis]
MRNEAAYNPFNDSSIHLTVPQQQVQWVRPEGFNDVIRHGEIVNGSLLPKELTAYPRLIRKFIQWGIIVYVAQFAAVLVYTMIEHLS